MNFQEIKQRYPHEWVLIEYEELGADLKVERGSVIAHSSNKEVIYKTLSQSFGKNVAIEYTGPVDQDLTVMFLFRCNPTR